MRLDRSPGVKSQCPEALVRSLGHLAVHPGKDAVRLVLLKDALAVEGKWVRGRGRSQRKEGGQRGCNHCRERRGKLGSGGDREEKETDNWKDSGDGGDWTAGWAMAGSER